MACGCLPRSLRHCCGRRLPRGRICAAPTLPCPAARRSRRSPRQHLYQMTPFHRNPDSWGHLIWPLHRLSLAELAVVFFHLADLGFALVSREDNPLVRLGRDWDGHGWRLRAAPGQLQHSTRTLEARQQRRCCAPPAVSLPAPGPHTSGPCCRARCCSRCRAAAASSPSYVWSSPHTATSEGAELRPPPPPQLQHTNHSCHHMYLPIYHLLPECLHRAPNAPIVLPVAIPYQPNTANRLPGIVPDRCQS